MGTTAIEHTPQEVTHIEIMRSLAQDFHDLPIVLKGGTALLLCYGLDRFSEDLDFDANKKFNLSGRIESIMARKAEEHTVKTVKNTDTVQRLKIHYIQKGVDRLLKLEVSLRDEIKNDDVVLIDGIKTYKVARLIEQKIEALLNRTKARDLYDVSFLLRQYRTEFTLKAVERLQLAVQDMNQLEARFRPAFEDDDLVDEDELTHILLDIDSVLNN